jgi:hypothetical protein
MLGLTREDTRSPDMEAPYRDKGIVSEGLGVLEITHRLGRLAH